jgi:hypothetical protein
VAGQSNNDLEVRNNYVVGGAAGLQIESWQTATVRDNIWLGSADMVYLTGISSGYSWSGNTWYRDATAPAWRFEGDPYTFDAWRSATGLGATDQTSTASPTGQTVFVRPNQYDPDRAYVIVYNWGGAAMVAVDVSGLLRTGDHYEVRNAQDIFGPPVASGTHSGTPLALPMGGVSPPTPIGRSTPTPPQTGPFFDVFVLTRTP